MIALEENLAQARRGEEDARQEADALRQEIATSQLQRDESGRDLTQARQSVEELMREKERLEELVRAATPNDPPPAPNETELNGHTEPVALAAAEGSAPESGEWLSFN